MTKIILPTPHPLGITTLPNWEKSKEFTQWIVEHFERLKVVYREEGVWCVNFGDWMEYVYKHERDLVEPHLN